MKLENVPIDRVADNPWRSRRLFPLDAEHVDDLRASIEEHNFFQSLKGRHRNGKVELACGHARVAAAEKAGYKTVPVFIDNAMDDDQMLRLMTDENALQSGTNPGAVMNEVAAVVRRLIEALTYERIVHMSPAVKEAFENQRALETAQGRLQKHTTDPIDSRNMPIGVNTIRRYLGKGNEDKAHRSLRQIRDAIETLKETNLYDEIIDEALKKYPESRSDKPSTSKTVIKTPRKSKPRKPKILNERCASVFPNDTQFDAFKSAVLTEAGRRFITLDQQYELAKTVMELGAKKKHSGVAFIKSYVGGFVRDATKAQKNLDEQEKQRLYREQRDQEIKAEVKKLESAYRSVISYSGKIAKLYEEFPASSYWGDLGGKARTCMRACEMISKTIK